MDKNEKYCEKYDLQNNRCVYQCLLCENWDITKKEIIKSEKEIILYFKKNIDNLENLEIMLKYCLSKQHYALSKLYLNQIQNIKYLNILK